MSIPSGIHTNLSETEYRSLEAVNQSSLKEILRSPAHYKAAIEKQTTPTSSMTFGSALHCFLLENKKFESAYAVGPMGITDKRTKAWKDFEKDVGEREVVSHEDFIGFNIIREAILKDPKLSDLFAEGTPETTLVWNDKKTGLKCKARLDWVTPTNVIVDVKSSKDARKYSFSKSILEYGYHFQAAFYINALSTLGGLKDENIRFKFVVIENTAPWSISIYRLGAKSLALGFDKVREALDKLAECREFNKYPGYSIAETEIEVPSYALEQD